MNTIDIIKEIISEIINVKPIDLQLEHHLRNDLGLDSIDILNVRNSIEERFNISLNETDIEYINTIQQISQLVKMKTNRKNLILKNATYFSGGLIFKDYSIVITGNRISRIIPSDITNVELFSENEYVIIDCTEYIVSAGFIDLHVNGGGGRDATEGKLDAVESIAKAHSMFGTTSILISLPGFGDENVKRCLEANFKAIGNDLDGANILGSHIEGPFINPKNKGAIPSDALCEPSIEKLLLYNDYSKRSLRIMTLAPELPGSEELIKSLNGMGIIASIGHSTATYEQTEEAINHGASHIAHIFNAMSQISAREPGVVGSALTNSRCYVELIADGFHVHPSNIKMLTSIKPLDKICLITDAVETVGTNRTYFEIPGLKVEVREGRTWGPNGMLVGSVLTMNNAIANMMKWTMLPLQKILLMATENPAKELNVYPQKGVISEGSDADIAILDSNYECVYTIVGGRVVYKNPNCE